MCSEVQCKGQLCLLQPLPGVPGWKLWGLVLLVCVGSAASSAETSTEGHELISTTLHTAVSLNSTILSPVLQSFELFWGSYCCKQACASHAWFCAGVFNEGGT